MKLGDIINAGASFVKKGTGSGINYLKGAASDLKEIVTPKKLLEPIERELSPDELERMKEIPKRKVHTVDVREEDGSSGTSSESTQTTKTHKRARKRNARKAERITEDTSSSHANTSENTQAKSEETSTPSPEQQQATSSQEEATSDTSDSSASNKSNAGNAGSSDTGSKDTGSQQQTSSGDDGPSAGSTQSFSNTTQTTTEPIPEQRALVPVQEEVSVGSKSDDGPSAGNTTSGDKKTPDSGSDSGDESNVPKELQGNGFSISAKRRRYERMKEQAESADENRKKALDALTQYRPDAMSDEQFEKMQKSINEMYDKQKSDFEAVQADPTKVKAHLSDYVLGNPHTSALVSGGATAGFLALQLSSSRGQLTNQQLYGQEDLT